MKSLKIDLQFQKNVYIHIRMHHRRRYDFNAWMQHLGSSLINQCKFILNTLQWEREPNVYTHGIV